MNCKQGDLAILVVSDFGLEGRIVRCVQFIGDVKWACGKVIPSWVVDPPLSHPKRSGRQDICGDDRLRPIRDPGPDAIDETIQRLGTPAQKALRELDEALSSLKRVSRELKELEKELAR